jgi:hypothetical protein
MGKIKAVDAVAKLVSLLESFEASERIRVIQASLTLLGDSTPLTELIGSGIGDDSGKSHGGKMDEKKYFDTKEPRNKGEEFAVAARYREERENAISSTRAELQKVITSARRNFDARNFKRDLENARTKGLFNRGTGRDSIVLSYFGQGFVDALPDRDAAKKIRGRKGKRGGKKVNKKARRT